MKKINLLAFFLITTTLTSCGNVKTNESMPEDSTFESAYQANINMRYGWNLGNTFDAWTNDFSYVTGSSETYWGNPYVTKELIQTVKDKGFTAIRFPITYTNHIDEVGNIDEDWLSRINEVVDYMMDVNLYCIINVHHDTGTAGWIKATTDNYDVVEAKFKNMWTQIADRFKNYDEHLLFEGYNEIIDNDSNWGGTSKENYQVCNKLNQVFVDTIRNSDGNNPTRNLIVSMYSASFRSNMVKGFVLPTDTYSNHLIIDVHNYDPQGFTLYNCTWEEVTREWSDTLTKRVENDFKEYDEISKKFKVPVMLGEFGAQNRNIDGEDYRYTKCISNQADKYGISTFIWDDGGSYRILNRHKLTWTRANYLKGFFNE